MRNKKIQKTINRDYHNSIIFKKLYFLFILGTVKYIADNILTKLSIF